MTNGTTATRERASGAKLTIEVYSVSRSGVVSPPRATVTVPHGWEPLPEPLSTRLAPCACPVHRHGGTAR